MYVPFRIYRGLMFLDELLLHFETLETHNNIFVTVTSRLIWHISDGIIFTILDLVNRLQRVVKRTHTYTCLFLQIYYTMITEACDQTSRWCSLDRWCTEMCCILTVTSSVHLLHSCDLNNTFWGGFSTLPKQLFIIILHVNHYHNSRQLTDIV